LKIAKQEMAEIVIIIWHKLPELTHYA